MKLKVYTGILFILVSLSAISQSTSIDTIMQLDTISVRAERYVSFSAGQKISVLSEATLNEDKRSHIGNILSENTSIYIRSYGQSNITSMSFRGTSSSQSGIFWNGINIRMPSLGSTDLSMIPSSFFNNASIVYGGSSIRYGSGTIGGAVFLNNTADFSSSTNADLNFYAGSFGSLGTHASAAISGNKFYIKLAFLGQEARNDFKYTNPRGEKLTMENAASSGLGFTAHAAALVGKKSQMDLFLWYQEVIREIPSKEVRAIAAMLKDEIGHLIEAKA